MSPKASPKSVLPTPEPDRQPEAPAFGWTTYTERLNGRFAMLGILGLLLIEVLTNQGLLAWLGLR